MSVYEDRYGVRNPLDPPDFVTQSANVDLEVGTLSEFHDHVMAEYNENFVPNWEKLKQEFAASKFGFDARFQEANYIALRHKEMMNDADRLGEQLKLGYLALAGAAKYMAQQYEGADDLSASNISQTHIDRAFVPEDSAPRPATPPSPGASHNRAI